MLIHEKRDTVYSVLLYGNSKNEMENLTWSTSLQHTFSGPEGTLTQLSQEHLDVRHMQ